MKSETLKPKGEIPQEGQTHIPEKPIGIEATLAMRKDELKPEVRFYADNLRAQINEICQEYGVQNTEEFLALAKDSKKVPLDKLKKLKGMLDKLNEVLETGSIQLQLERLRKQLKLPPESEFFSAEAIQAFRIVFEGLGEDTGAPPESEILYSLYEAMPEIDGSDYIDYSKDGFLKVATGVEVHSGDEEEPKEFIPILARMQRTMDALRTTGYVFEPSGSGSMPYEFVAHKKVEPSDLRDELKMLKEVYEKAAVDKKD